MVNYEATSNTSLRKSQKLLRLKFVEANSSDGRLTFEQELEYLAIVHYHLTIPTQYLYNDLEEHS